MIRKPAQAGVFYPANKNELNNQLSQFIKEARKEEVKGIVVPHAGYIYSGKVSGAVYSRIKQYPVYIIIGPNHTGLGAPVSLMSEGEWEMPAGKVKINSQLSKKILEKIKFVEDDINAHIYEHSIEVQLPFLQYLREDFSFVPIVLGDYRLSTIEKLGEGLAEIVKNFGEETLIIASSDMSHYEPDEVAREKDKQAIDKILNLEPAGLLEIVKTKQISMCGVGPVATMLFAAKKLGAKEAELVSYQTSGQISGDYSAVVGYAGIIVK